MVDDGKEQKKEEMARAVLAGNASFINDGAHVFDGLSPSEIEEYVLKATKGASASDPFEVTGHASLRGVAVCTRHTEVRTVP